LPVSGRIRSTLISESKFIRGIFLSLPSYLAAKGDCFIQLNWFKMINPRQLAKYHPPHKRKVKQ